MVLSDSTKSLKIKIGLIFGERFHVAVEGRSERLLKITVLQLASKLLHSLSEPEILAHCTVNTLAYRSLTFDTAVAKTEHLPAEILEEKVVILPTIPLAMQIKPGPFFPSSREPTQKRS